MKSTFDNAKKVNDLSKDINDNINNYIFYRKLYETLKEKSNEIISNILKGELNLNSLIKKTIEVRSKNDILNNSNYDMKIRVDIIDRNYQTIKNNLINLYFSNYMKKAKKDEYNKRKIQKKI